MMAFSLFSRRQNGRESTGPPAALPDRHVSDPVSDDATVASSPSASVSASALSTAKCHLQQIEQDGAKSVPDHLEVSLPYPLLMDVASAIQNREQCIRLAVKLELEEDEVLSLLAKKFTGEMPLDILFKWIQTHPLATGADLHAALREIERQDLADRFERELLQGVSAGGVSSAQVVMEQATSSPQSVGTGMPDVSQMRPPLGVLLEIAFLLPKLRHSVRLAKCLGLREEFVERVRLGAFAADTAALNVLCKWRQQKSREATGRVLFEALIQIRRRDIAVCFAGRLLGQEEKNWQDLCYDDKHRTFYRLLCQQHIDVVAAYEGMHCSEDFLGHLHQKGILQHAEYEEVLDCLRTSLRSAVNRKLLDIVNASPTQLQEMFAHLLRHYQPHVVMLDEETISTLPDSSHQFECDFSIDTPWQLQGQNLLLDFKNELRRYFNQLIVARPLDFVACEDFQPVSEIYVTLSSISYEEALKLISGPQQLRSSELLKAGSQIAAESNFSQELHDLHSLLCYSHGVQAKSAVLFGSAGAGKSLTTLKILSEWNSQDSMSPFKQFEVIILITGREYDRLSAKEIHGFWQLWQMGYNERQQEFILDYYSHHSEKVLFLIDGWDEAGNKCCLQEDTVLKQILGHQLFRNSSIIITSRPAPSAYPLLEECKRRYSLVGFNNNRLRELFNRRLEERQASKLYDTLSQSSHLHVKSAVQKTPLFATMLVQLYKMEETLPSTITALYQSMLDCMRRRYVLSEHADEGSRRKMKTFNKKAVKANFDQAERKLSTLALAGWISSKVTFTHQEVLSSGKAVIQQRFGLLSEVKEIGMHGSRVLYHFNHLTWQEFLAARSLAAESDFVKKLQMCVHSIGVGEHTRLFWRFLSGLVESHLLPDLVFELAKAGGLSGEAPWETELRLFLLDCLAEYVRMKQMSSEQFCTDQFVQLAGEMLTTSKYSLHLNGCILDAGQWSSLALVLRACPSISHLAIFNSRAEYDCPNLSASLHHLYSLQMGDISGSKASSFAAAIIRSLSSSDTITDVLVYNIPATTELLAAFSQLINNSGCLTDIAISSCEVRLAGLRYLSRAIRHSSSLSAVTFRNDSFAGAGGLLGDICVRLPHLQSLMLIQCGLGDPDMAGLLPRLQKSVVLQVLNVTGNQLTNNTAISVEQFAAGRELLAQHALASRIRLPELNFYVAGNDLSEHLLLQLATVLPPTCGMKITDDHVMVGHNLIGEVHYGWQMKSLLASSVDGHITLKGRRTRDHGAAQVAEVLATDSTRLLKSLSLSCCDITDTGVAAVVAALPHSKLQGLDLSRNNITVNGFHRLMLALSGDVGLQYLNVSDNPIFANQGLLQSQLTPSIFSLSMSIQSLEIMSVSSTKFSDEVDCFENSPLALMAIPSLVALDLSNNEITDRSVVMIMQWIDKLSYLSLSGNRLSSDGAKLLVEKAQRLIENSADQQQPHSHLRRIWLGGNCIAESVFADSNCEAISNESFSLEDHIPRVVPAMFSSSGVDRSQVRTSQILSSACGTDSPFWARMNTVVQMEVFNDFLHFLLREKEKVGFGRWVTNAFQALAWHGDVTENERIGQAHALINVLRILSKWYPEHEDNGPMALVIFCCMVCIMDELVLTQSISVLESRAEEAMDVIVRLSKVHNDYLSLAMQSFSGLAERCRRQELHQVADQLLQRMEYVLQQGWTVLK